jgi:Peptidase family M48
LRIILLSPEEEDQIAAQLAGPGWYRAVSDILSSQEDGGLPSIVTPNDWRYLWVDNTLRRLESVIPILQDESLASNWLTDEPTDSQLPPPAEYPLRPRPRATEYLRMICNMSYGKVAPAPAHTVAGPPYSLLIVDRPGAANAFSYGFGPNGGGGIVLFTGFLDEIMADTPPDPNRPTQAPPEEVSWWSFLFGFLPSTPLRPSRVEPTPEQTSQLAVLLAHELSHLLLSHHLESLSSASIIVPGVMSIITDTIRALLFPITMLFGPFVNDAVADIGKIGSGEVSKLGLLCSSRKQEVEADIVSTRFIVSTPHLMTLN